MIAFSEAHLGEEKCLQTVPMMRTLWENKLCEHGHVLKKTLCRVMSGQSTHLLWFCCMSVSQLVVRHFFFFNLSVVACMLRVKCMWCSILALKLSVFVSPLNTVALRFNCARKHLKTTIFFLINKPKEDYFPGIYTFKTTTTTTVYVGDYLLSNTLIPQKTLKD